jgi:hypothetical protein
MPVSICRSSWVSVVDLSWGHPSSLTVSAVAILVELRLATDIGYPAHLIARQYQLATNDAVYVQSPYEHLSHWS